MTEPQIARRCPSCGASIRSLAFFCPQCGKEIANSDSEPAIPHTTVVTAPLDGTALNDGTEVNKTGVPSGSEPHESKKPFEERSRAIVAPPQKVGSGSQPEPGQPRRHRATNLARDVEGDVIHRVQKLRKISTVVLDEASYDPSLRFVLIAAALFLLFLIIVLLNKFIR